MSRLAKTLLIKLFVFRYSVRCLNKATLLQILRTKEVSASAASRMFSHQLIYLPCFFLQLSEAYCLLWQDSSTGNVDGRQGSKRKLGGAVFAVLMDLLVLGKIKIDVVEKKFLGIAYRNRNIVVSCFFVV